MRKVPILLALATLVPASWVVAAGQAAGQAGAAAVVSTAAATDVTSSGATLNGTVNPEGQATVYAFQWGPTTGYGLETPLPPASAGSGTASAAETATLSALAPGTAYHYRVIAISAGGVTTGSDETFTTGGTPPSPTTPPTVASAPETNVGSTGATLNGTVNPEGQSTSYYFEYGTTAAYGFQTAAANAGAGTSSVPASSNLTGLAPGTSYHYRLVAVSAGGTTLGNDQTLTTTLPPTVTTGTATSVGPTGATLNGTVNPDGHATTDYFQFGTTTAYDVQTTPTAAGSGTTNVAVTAPVTALQAATTYHYRLVAVNSLGTSYGSDQTLTTAAAPPSSSLLELFASTAFVSPRGVGGFFVGCFGQASCTGSIRISRSGVTLGQRALFSVNADNGGIVHLTLTSLGEQLLRQRHQLRVQTVLSQTGGNQTQAVVTLVPYS
jgi:hypothetical protein